MKWFNFFLHKSRIENQLDSELSFHLDAVIQEKIAAGLSPQEARRLARLEFGGAEQIKEECRSVHRLPLIETTVSHLKSALRFIRRSPTFSAAIILTLALGIGANSAVFSAIDAILLSPLHYASPDQLVVLHQLDHTAKEQSSPIAPVRLEEWNQHNSTFQAIAGSYTQDLSETSGVVPERLVEADVTPRFLQVLGVAPELGRDFTPAEEHFGGPSAILISQRFWQRRFQGDPHVLGKTLRLESTSFPIIGVLPASFDYPDKSVDLWQVVPTDAPFAQNRSSTWFAGIGRLKAGLTVARATADLNTLQARLGRQFPSTDKNLSADIQPLKETMIGGVRSTLLILFGSVTLLLLIACTNIAALLLSRTTQRAREISIRYSLGASRGSLIMQLLTEAFVLALAGSAIGLAIAAAATRVFHSLGQSLPRAQEISLNWRLVLFTLACAVVSTLLGGLVPALIASRRPISSTLAAHSRSHVSSRNPWQWSLVGVQVALAFTLLVGAGLLLRSFQELGRVTPGFDASHVLVLRVSGNYGETTDQPKMYQRMKNILNALLTVPGVDSAAISVTVPGAAQGFPTEMKVADASVSPDRKIAADEKVVFGAYFETMRIQLMAGTTCSGDTLWKKAVVNRSFAEAYFPTGTAIGHHLVVTPFDEQPEIVGIAADARENSLNQAPRPTLYWCSSNGTPFPYFLIRTHGDPMNLATALRLAVHRVEPQRSVFDVMPLAQHLSATQSENRFRTVLLTLFALIAISLAAIGLYGTLSYLVELRHREIGLRIALGALPRQIRASFFAKGASISLLGCAAGFAMATSFSRLLIGVLYGVSTLDPFTYIAVTVGFLCVSAIASGLPAARAARLDPMEILRQD